MTDTRLTHLQARRARLCNGCAAMCVQLMFGNQNGTLVSRLENKAAGLCGSGTVAASDAESQPRTPVHVREITAAPAPHEGEPVAKDRPRSTKGPPRAGQRP